MKKKSIKPGTMVNPVPAVLVTSGTYDGEKDIITIAWTGIVNSEPPMTYISVRESRHSYGLIKENMEFVINLPTADMAYKVDWCGMKSGEKDDKFAEMDFTPLECSMVKTPMIEQCPVNLECKVHQIVKLPSHDMFIADIINVNVDDSIISDNGKIELGKIGLLSYNHGEYFALENEPIGRFGFSVMKAKTRKRISKEAHMDRIRANKEKRKRK